MNYGTTSLPEHSWFWCVLRFWSWLKLILQFSQTNFFLWCTSSMCLLRLAKQPNTFPQISQLKPLPMWRFSCLAFPDRLLKVFSQNRQCQKVRSDTGTAERDRRSFCFPIHSLQRWIEQDWYWFMTVILLVQTLPPTFWNRTEDWLCWKYLAIILSFNSLFPRQERNMPIYYQYQHLFSIIYSNIPLKNLITQFEEYME